MSDPRPGSCASCANTDCRLHAVRELEAVRPRHALLADDVWPEFLSWLDGQAVDIKPAAPSWFKAWRGLSLRAARRTGGRLAQRREVFSARLYAIWRRHLTYDVERFTIGQNFLAAAQRRGDLGGRPYNVLLTRYPYRLMQAKLDEAALAHLDSRTLRDFRVSEAAMHDEEDALSGARRLVTPHADLAKLFPDKTIFLPWQIPTGWPKAKGDRVAFLGPTIGRKGCHAVRDIAHGLPAPLIVFGTDLESENFWAGVSIERRTYSPAALHDVGAILHPSIVEMRPRRLLDALSAGVKIYATAACGLPAELYDGIENFQPSWPR